MAHGLGKWPGVVGEIEKNGFCGVVPSPKANQKPGTGCGQWNEAKWPQECCVVWGLPMECVPLEKCACLPVCC